MGVRIPLYLCTSDSAPDIFRGEITCAATSYMGNSGSGVQLHGYDGLFRHFAPAYPDIYAEGPVRFADIVDGLSTTAAASEVLHSLGGIRRDRLRIAWNTPAEYSDAQVEAFKSDCRGLPPSPTEFGWKGSPIAHGWKWVYGETGYSTYNHMLPPMQPSCFNQTQVQLGI